MSQNQEEMTLLEKVDQRLSDLGKTRVWLARKAGMTPQQLWSILHEVKYAKGYWRQARISQVLNLRKSYLFPKRIPPRNGRQ